MKDDVLKELQDKSIAQKPLKIPGRRIIVTKYMIESAIENTRSNLQASKWLGISFITYKKWAVYYGLYEQHCNKGGVGIKKGYGSYKIPLEDIFSGKSSRQYPQATFKEGYLDEECGSCGWNEKNIITGKICLSLDFIDGDIANKSLENVRLLCPNCFYSNNGRFPNSSTFCL